jgi:hypothetical protein
VTAYLLQQIQLLAHRDSHGLAPWSATGNRSAEPMFQFDYESAVPSGRPMPSASLNEMNFSSQSSNNKSRKVGQRSITGRTGTRRSSTPTRCARTPDHVHSWARDTSRARTGFRLNYDTADLNRGTGDVHHVEGNVGDDRDGNCRRALTVHKYQACDHRSAARRAQR